LQLRSIDLLVLPPDAAFISSNGKREDGLQHLFSISNAFERSQLRAENKLAIAERPVFDFAAMSFPAVALTDSALLKAVRRRVGG
jgi:hypothetical protein